MPGSNEVTWYVLVKKKIYSHFFFFFFFSFFFKFSRAYVYLKATLNGWFIIISYFWLINDLLVCLAMRNWDEIFVSWSSLECIWAFLTVLSTLLDAPSDWRPGGRGFNPRRGRQHSFMEIDHEIFSTVILSLPLIQEGQLSVSGERMCTILVNRLED